MRESRFIRQRKENWRELEKALDQQDRDPGRINRLFTEILDDLSYARTFYPNRSVRVYLNSLARKLYFRVYAARRTGRDRLVGFWLRELPSVLFRNRKALWLSLAVFILAFSIGLLSAAMEPEFARSVLGDAYTDMTLDNIRSGDPMAVYKQRGAFGMWLGITANNLMVAFRAFIMGVFFAIGTLWILLQNGIMIGAFQYFFVEQGVFGESFLTIWVHGTLEIASVILSGAGGLILGKGLLFPGTLPRLKAFRKGARDGLKVLLGVTPLFILAAFIEGFLTRQTETPDWIRLSFILACLLLVAWYFFYYPYRLSRKGQLYPEALPGPDFRPNGPIDLKRIKSVGEVYAETYRFFGMEHTRLLWLAVPGALLWASLGYSFLPEALWQSWIREQYLFDPVRGLMLALFGWEAFLPVMVNFANYSILVLGLSRIMGHWSPYRYAGSGLGFPGAFLKIAPATLFLATLPLFQPIVGFLLLLTAVPLLLLWTTVYTESGKGFSNAWRSTVSLMAFGFWKYLGLLAVHAFTLAFFLLILNTSVFRLPMQAVLENLEILKDMYPGLFGALLFFFYAWVLNLAFLILLLGGSLMYFSLLEIDEARDLLDRIRRVISHKE